MIKLESFLPSTIFLLLAQGSPLVKHVKCAKLLCWAKNNLLTQTSLNLMTLARSFLLCETQKRNHCQNMEKAKSSFHSRILLLKATKRKARMTNTLPSVGCGQRDSESDLKLNDEIRQSVTPEEFPQCCNPQGMLLVVCHLMNEV